MQGRGLDQMVLQNSKLQPLSGPGLTPQAHHADSAVIPIADLGSDLVSHSSLNAHL